MVTRLSIRLADLHPRCIEVNDKQRLLPVVFCQHHYKVSNRSICNEPFAPIDNEVTAIRGDHRAHVFGTEVGACVRLRCRETADFFPSDEWHKVPLLQFRASVLQCFPCQDAVDVHDRGNGV
ncbi:hypothetical protein D3C75_852650 [compost metagenome]